MLLLKKYLQDMKSLRAGDLIHETGSEAPILKKNPPRRIDDLISELTKATSNHILQPSDTH